VIRAMASGDVQLGEVGSTGIATAISQGMDVELFWILEDIAPPKRWSRATAAASTRSPI
jgi:ABC-type taurine transport system substrate-binding protein